jgi:CTP:molybdopterin cytidylyltransferase MocA
MTFAGLVLAAGGGLRLGMPKGLVRDPDGTPWVARSVHTLIDGGCGSSVVVLGAAAEQVRLLLPDSAAAVVASDWAQGIAASIRAGLRALDERDPAGIVKAAVLTHVDLPGLPATVVRRLVEGAEAGSLRQARYGKRPGHPVVLGRSHWRPVADSVQGDSGARGWLLAHGVEEIDCTDLFDGADIDTPEQLARRHAG